MSSTIDASCWRERLWRAHALNEPGDLMNILDAILNTQGGAATQQLGNQFGLRPEQTQAALSTLVPALVPGFSKT
jgi:hypothetical protein